MLFDFSHFFSKNSFSLITYNELFLHSLIMNNFIMMLLIILYVKKFQLENDIPVNKNLFNETVP